MNILANYQTKMQTPKPVENNTIQKSVVQKPDILDILSEKVVNRRDITDTVTIPRAIFKGYLCFTLGTAINSIAGLLKQSKITKALNISGSLISIYGTYNFVKGFLVQDKKLTETGK